MTVDAPPAVDSKPPVDTPIVVMPDTAPGGVDAAPAVDVPLGTADTPPPPIDAPPPIDSPPPPIDSPPQIDSPPGDPCGNGVVDPGEKCDIGIAQGNAGACPTDCNDSQVCTDDALVGVTCQQECTHTPRTANPVADGCCPGGATGLTDPDCAVCGNGTVELGEVCDDHNTDSGDGCSGDCQREIVGYRITELTLQFPHTFLAFGCSDVTSIVQGAITDQITKDSNTDGFFDLSPMVVFKPYDTDDGTTPADIVFAKCHTSTQSNPRCLGTGLTGNDRIAATATNTLTGGTACLTNYPLPPPGAAARGYAVAITSAGPTPCFSTNAVSLTLNISGAVTVTVPLDDVKVAAVYNQSPATQLTSGLLRGFLTETNANSIMVLGVPLSQFLAGGSGACPAWNDREDGPIGAANPVHGWYFYLNFTAVRETYVDQ